MFKKTYSILAITACVSTAAASATFGSQSKEIQLINVPQGIKKLIQIDNTKDGPKIFALHVTSDKVMDYAIPVKGSCTYNQLCTYDLVDGKTAKTIGRVSGSSFVVQKTIINGRYTIASITENGSNSATVAFYIPVSNMYALIGQVSVRGASYDDLKQKGLQ